MAYDSLEQQDHDLDDHDHGPDCNCDVEVQHDAGLAKNSPAHAHHQPPLHPPAVGMMALRQIVQTGTGRSRSETDSSYEMIENDDYDEDLDPTLVAAPGRPALPIPLTEDGNNNSNNTTNATNTTNNTTNTLHLQLDRSPSPSIIPQRIPPPVLRTAVPADTLALRHPTPVDDQRVRLASYTGTIETLERTAERLSMTSSSIDDAIREMHCELKRNDSRRSPLRSSPDVTTISTRAEAANPSIDTHQASHSNPAGVARSASKSSRFGTRPEPELEGRPLDSFAESSEPVVKAPSLQGPTEQVEEEEYVAMDRKLEVRNPEPAPSDEGRGPDPSRPSSPSSADTFDVERAFAGFDGAHAPMQQQQRVTIQDPEMADALGLSARRASSGALLAVDGIDSNPQRRVKDRHSVANPPQRQPRMSSAERMSMARSQSYEDPDTGHQMLYYPAPVPVMLNLPQKLSKAPSSIARSKRRTQVLSTVPAPARQTAIWLPDVLEIEDQPNLPEDDNAQQLEYVPQHQRMSMGGRRVPQDVQHVPPQLRASAFFDLPAPEQVVELKEQSAMATLDSILDASAHAPVTAFTDHLIAGHLGAEVYGQAKAPNRGSTANLLSPEEKAPKKRSSAFNILGRRVSSGNTLDTETETRRAAIIADIRAGKIIKEDDEEEVVSDRDEEPEEEPEYHGAPTTLLAELQLRKQQQKHRTRPLITAYPNGLHSTLLELDTLAQAEAETRKQKKVTLAWEDHSADEHEEVKEDDDDDDVPLALIYAKNSQKAQDLDLNRPLGLIERRDLEENEPLSQRRDRLQGKIPEMTRASMLSLNPPPPPPPEEEGETLGERLARLNGDNEEAVTDLPKARPVSGDFASEMMSQFGGDLLDVEDKDKGKESPTNEEEETLGQRRKRLQAEAQARAAEVGVAPSQAPGADRPEVFQRHSMADILHYHPQAGGIRTVQQKPATGLLGLNERMGAPRPTAFGIPSRAPAGGFKGGMYNDGQAGTAPKIQRQINPYDTAAMHQFPQPSLGFAGAFGAPQQMYNPNMMFGAAQGQYANAGYQTGTYPIQMSYLPQIQNTMATMGMLNMNMGNQPLNQGQIDMVERWRQSVMQ